MAQAGVIRDFMVALGFKTDNSGLKQMQDAMGGVELKAAALKGALLALATGAVVAVRQTAGELDKLYFSSQRIGASVTNINAYGNAIAQLGGSAEGAVGSLDSLAEKMRNSPGYEGMINSLGVQTKDANGAVRDRVEVMKDLSGVLSKMPAYQANAYANSLGIDQNTLLAMRDGKFVSNMEKYQKIQKELGMNDDLAKSGNEFMTEYRDLTMMTKTSFQVIVMQAGKALIPILRLLNTMIRTGISAFSQLHPAIKGVLSAGLKLAMFALVLNALIKSFGMLKIGLGVIKMFIPALKAFRLAFLASPIGIILALATALALLWDDYKTWRDGGKSLFDWSKWTNGIDTIIQKIKDFLEILDQVKDKVINFVQKVITDPAGAIKEVAEVAADGVKNLAQKGADALNDKIAETEKGAKALDKVGETTAKTLAFFGNEEAKKAVEINEGKPAITAKGLATGAAKAVDKAVTKIVGVNKDSFSSFIGKGEGGYNSVNLGKKYGYRASTRNLTKMTVQQVYDMQKSREVNAVGKFQIIRDTMPTVIKGMKLTGKELFDEEMQERMGAWLMFNNRKTLSNYLKGKHNDLRAAGDDGAREWASLPVLSNKLTTKAGKKTYHSKKGGTAYSDGVNKALHSPESYERILKQARENYLNAVKGGMSESEAQVISFRGLTHLIKNKQTATPKNSQDLAKFAQNAEIPSGNPHKSQVNSSNMSASNVTIHQSFKTDMTLNGVNSPVESANAVKRQQENSMVIAARGAKSLIG